MGTHFSCCTAGSSPPEEEEGEKELSFRSRGPKNLRNALGPSPRRRLAGHWSLRNVCDSFLSTQAAHLARNGRIIIERTREIQRRAPTSKNEARASIWRGSKHVRDRTISHGRAHRENVADAGISRPGSGNDDTEHQE